MATASSSFGIPGHDDELPTALAIAADGRLAITGATTSPGARDTFVAVLGADGTPTAFGTAGVAVRDAGAGSDDTGADVAWGARGPVALVETAVGPADRHTALLAFTDAGADDAAFGGGTGSVALDAGGTDTTAGGLLAYGGRLWATGSVTVDVDVDAYLARVDGDGGHPVARRFDMRGSVFPASQQVKSVGEDLTLAPGEPDTLVVGGSVFTDAGLEVAAAAFNLLDGELPALQMTELVIPVEGQGAAVGVAGGSGGAVALTATARDFSLETNSGSDDLSIAMARVLVDAEKRCDLSLSVAAPLELVMRGLAPSSVTLRATNAGQRACGGTISVPAPYSLAPAELVTGKLGPGQSIALTPAIAYGAALPADGTLEFTLTAPDDAAKGDNVARLHVLFSFCDLELRRVETPRMAGFEGAQRYGFTVRNAGTTDCTRTAIAVGGSGRRALLTERYTVPAGQSVTDEVQVAVRRRTVRPGGRAPITFAVATTGDVRLANNTQRAAPGGRARGGHERAPPDASQPPVHRHGEGRPPGQGRQAADREGRPRRARRPPHGEVVPLAGRDGRRPARRAQGARRHLRPAGVDPRPRHRGLAPAAPRQAAQGPLHAAVARRDPQRRRGGEVLVQRPQQGAVPHPIVVQFSG